MQFAAVMEKMQTNNNTLKNDKNIILHISFFLSQSNTSSTLSYSICNAG